MSDENALREMQNLPVPEMSEQLAALDTASLQALRKLEVSDNGGRKGALAAIDSELKSRAESGDSAGKADDGGNARTAAQASGKADEGAWRAEDYTGPLTADQAEWRNATFKPVQVARTK